MLGGALESDHFTLHSTHSTPDAIPQGKKCSCIDYCSNKTGAKQVRRGKDKGSASMARQPTPFQSEDDLETKYLCILHRLYESYCSEKRNDLQKTPDSSFDDGPLSSPLRQDFEVLKQTLENAPTPINDASIKVIHDSPVARSISCSATSSKENTGFPTGKEPNFYKFWDNFCPPKFSTPTSNSKIQDNFSTISLHLSPDNDSLSVELLDCSHDCSTVCNQSYYGETATGNANDSNRQDTSPSGSHLAHSGSNHGSIVLLDEYEEDPWIDFNHEERTGSEEELMAITTEEDADGVLCGNRVSQMTRTYHDIEAVTRLLQEKEKDLELAARIGQQLLARNKGLQEKNSSLEAELCSSSERITQLKHDLLMKTDLLQIYTNDFDDSSAENTPTSLRHINVDLLQRRVKTLENENVYLREEASQLADDTDYCEEKEKELVNDVIKQLNEANLQVNQLSDELSRKIEDNLRQQEELTQLLAQVVDLQATNKRRTRENEELGSLIGVARECQQELSTELAELKEKYAEVLDLLHDTQEQLRRVQKKSFPGSRVSHLGGGGMFSSLHFGSDSIASELHSLSSAEDQTEKTDGAKCLSRVFDTVRLSSKLGNSLPPAGYTGSPVYSTPTKQASQVASHFSTPLHMTGSYSSYFGSGVSIGGSSGLHSLDSGAESDGSFPTDSEDNYPASRPGVPGWPGTPDLDSCLRRLGPQDRNSLSYLPYGCRTPDSIMSTGSAKSGMSSYSSQNWKLPQKLQIVKPIEGSLTLHHWSRLATPHLGGLLEDKEGIAVKGATNSGLNLELYSMSDLEEEEEEEENEENKCFPGKQFMSTSGVFTYTNSTVLHPDDVTNLTSSLRQTQMSALPSAPVYDSLPSTPSHSASSQPPSRRGSTATFSTSIGIAKHLRERGFTDEPQSSALPLTATPANSPEGTRAGTPEPYTYKLPCFEDLTRHFHAGASFIRRHFYGDITPSNASSPGEGPKVNLVERIHALGVERLVGSTEFTQSVGGVVMTRPQPVSPLLHLSNLIRSNAKNTSGVTTTGDSSSSTQGSIMSTPRITSPGERRPQIPTGAPMGIPGHPGAGHLDSRLTQLKPGQRLDLGTVGSVGSRPRPAALGSVPLGRKDEKMGTIGWTSLGRKGGLS